jgi:sensor histidine kinase YesM
MIVCVQIVVKTNEHAYFWFMIAFLKKYKAFFIGFVITRVLAWILAYKGVILIDKNEHLTNILGFIFYWFFVSIFIHKIQYLKKHIKSVIKIVGFLILLIVILIIDSNSAMRDNPITILLFVVFYLTIAFVLVPNFFKKYRVPIISVYALAYSVFLYFRLFSESYEMYRQQSTEIFLLFFLPIPIFASLWTYQQWKWFQNLKAEKSQAELAMLQAQVNPHFFFNTLNNLYALTIKNSNKAPEVILKLSDMMRYTIYEGKKGYVSIKEEIDYLNNYIELHKIRYKKEVDIQFNHTIENDIKIPPLLFIILLENAFKHGVESLSENAYIHINLLVKNGFIQFEIENNFELQSNDGNGIGLENLQRRLHLLFDKNYTLTNETKGNIYKSTLKIPIDA